MHYSEALARMAPGDQQETKDHQQLRQGRSTSLGKSTAHNACPPTTGDRGRVMGELWGQSWLCRDFNLGHWLGVAGEVLPARARLLFEYHDFFA